MKRRGGRWRLLGICSRAVLGAALVLASSACQPRHEQLSAVVHDLVAELPGAELHREVGTIDFGTAAARPFLAQGWYQNEGGGRQGPTIVWSKGERSALDFWLAATRALRAEIRCAPFEPPDGLPQVVTLELNGRRIGELTLRPKLNDYAIDLPRDAQIAGPNRLEFRYRIATRAQHRLLAVSWDLLRLLPGPAVPAELPRAEARPGASALVLPFGTEAGYHFALEEGGTLFLQGLRGQESGTLQVIAQEEGGPEKLLGTLKPGTGPRTLELPGDGERLVRLVLRAVPDNPGSDGGLLLLGPAVRVLAAARHDQTAASIPPERPNVIIYLVDTLR